MAILAESDWNLVPDDRNHGTLQVPNGVMIGNRCFDYNVS